MAAPVNEGGQAVVFENASFLGDLVGLVERPRGLGAAAAPIHAEDHWSIERMILVQVPTPPSTNRIWRTGKQGQTYKGAKYQDWLGHAGWVLRGQKPGRINGRVVVLVSVERLGPTADIDNRIKALFDLLVAEKVIEDDSKIVGFAAAWAPAANGVARLLIMPAATFAARFLLADDGATGGWFIAPDEDENGDYGIEGLEEAVGE